MVEVRQIVEIPPPSNTGSISVPFVVQIVFLSNNTQIEPANLVRAQIMFSAHLVEIEAYLEPQEEGGFVAYSKKYPGAVGQGETEEEALHDLEESVELLKEVLDEDRKE